MCVCVYACDIEKYVNYDIFPQIFVCVYMRFFSNNKNNLSHNINSINKQKSLISDRKEKLFCCCCGLFLIQFFNYITNYISKVQSKMLTSLVKDHYEKQAIKKEELGNHHYDKNSKFVLIFKLLLQNFPL